MDENEAKQDIKEYCALFCVIKNDIKFFKFKKQNIKIFRFDVEKSMRSAVGGRSIFQSS